MRSTSRRCGLTGKSRHVLDQRRDGGVPVLVGHVVDGRRGTAPRRRGRAPDGRRRPPCSRPPRRRRPSRPCRRALVQSVSAFAAASRSSAAAVSASLAACARASLSAMRADGSGSRGDRRRACRPRRRWALRAARADWSPATCTRRPRPPARADRGRGGGEGLRMARKGTEPPGRPRSSRRTGAAVAWPRLAGSVAPGALRTRASREAPAATPASGTLRRREPRRTSDRRHRRARGRVRRHEPDRASRDPGARPRAALAKGAHAPKGAFQGGLTFGVLGEADLLPRPRAETRAAALVPRDRRAARPPRARRPLRRRVATCSASCANSSVPRCRRPRSSPPPSRRSRRSRRRRPSTRRSGWSCSRPARSRRPATGRIWAPASSAAASSTATTVFAPAAGGTAHRRCVTAGPMRPLAAGRPARARALLHRAPARSRRASRRRPPTSASCARSTISSCPYVLDREPRGLRSTPATLSSSRARRDSVARRARGIVADLDRECGHAGQHRGDEARARIGRSRAPSRRRSGSRRPRARAAPRARATRAARALDRCGRRTPATAIRSVDARRREPGDRRLSRPLVARARRRVRRQEEEAPIADARRLGPRIDLARASERPVNQPRSSESMRPAVPAQRERERCLAAAAGGRHDDDARRAGAAREEHGRVKQMETPSRRRRSAIAGIVSRSATASPGGAVASTWSDSEPSARKRGLAHSRRLDARRRRRRCDRRPPPRGARSAPGARSSGRPDRRARRRAGRTRRGAADSSSATSGPSARAIEAASPSEPHDAVRRRGIARGAECRPSAGAAHDAGLRPAPRRSRPADRSQREPRVDVGRGPRVVDPERRERAHEPARRASRRPRARAPPAAARRCALTRKNRPVRRWSTTASPSSVGDGGVGARARSGPAPFTRAAAAARALVRLRARRLARRWTRGASRPAEAAPRPARRSRAVTARWWWWQIASASASDASSGPVDRREAEHDLHHRAHALLAGAPGAGDGALDDVVRVARDGDAGLGEHDERRAAPLADADGGAHVAPVEDLLDRRLVGTMRGDDLAQARARSRAGASRSGRSTARARRRSPRRRAASRRATRRPSRRRGCRGRCRGCGDSFRARPRGPCYGMPQDGAVPVRPGVAHGDVARPAAPDLVTRTRAAIASEPLDRRPQRSIDPSPPSSPALALRPPSRLPARMSARAHRRPLARRDDRPGARARGAAARARALRPRLPRLRRGAAGHGEDRDRARAARGDDADLRRLPATAIYVNNFRHPERPRLLEVGRGRGAALARAIEARDRQRRGGHPPARRTTRCSRSAATRSSNRSREEERHARRRVREGVRRRGLRVGSVETAGAAPSPTCSLVVGEQAVAMADLDAAIRAEAVPAERRGRDPRAAPRRCVRGSRRRCAACTGSLQERRRALDELERAAAHQILDEIGRRAAGGVPRPRRRRAPRGGAGRLHRALRRLRAGAARGRCESESRGGPTRSATSREEVLREFRPNLLLDPTVGPGLPDGRRAAADLDQPVRPGRARHRREGQRPHRLPDDPGGQPAPGRRRLPRAPGGGPPRPGRRLAGTEARPEARHARDPPARRAARGEPARPPSRPDPRQREGRPARRRGHLRRAARGRPRVRRDLQGEGRLRARRRRSNAGARSPTTAPSSGGSRPRRGGARSTARGSRRWPRRACARRGARGGSPCGSAASPTSCARPTTRPGARAPTSIGAEHVAAASAAAARRRAGVAERRVREAIRRG